ncbi:hypothetical protein C8Q80DRAFT_824951 [Daedaleopsis nitida]|nr:hypothetical protein C8Q80DRAFT_824951 [Daedaleopsis nitida]
MASSASTPFTSPSPTSMKATPFESLTPSFSFNTVSRMTTCTSAKIQWAYDGYANNIALLLMNAGPMPSSRSLLVRTTKKRGVVALPLALGLNATGQSWTWPTVNVTSGWYLLEAVGSGVAAMSSTFFVANGTDTRCLANSQTPITLDSSIGSPSTTVPQPTPAESAASQSISAAPPHTGHSSGTIFGATLAAVAIFAAAAYVVHRLLIPRLSRRRNPRLSIMEEAKELDKDDNSLFSSSLHVHAGEKQFLAVDADGSLETIPKLRPLPPIPSDQSRSFFPPPLSSPPPPTNASIDARVATAAPCPPVANPRALKAATLARLDTNLALTMAPSTHTTPFTRRSVYDQSDAASSFWGRRYSAGSSWSAGLSRRGSPVPSSATSQMYRVRDSALSAWTLIRSYSRDESERDKDSPSHRKAASVDGLKLVRSATTMSIPDVPPLPAHFRTEARARQSVG